MEQEYNSNSSDPTNEIVEIINHVKSRDADRQRAIDLAYRRARDASSIEEKNKFLRLAQTMEENLAELHHLYPELYTHSQDE